NTALDVIGLPALLAIAGFLASRRQHGTVGVRPDGQHPSATDPTLQYLVAISVSPVTMAVLGALIGGFGMKHTWGIPMLNHLGLLMMALLPGWLDRYRLRSLARAAAAVLVVGPLSYALVLPVPAKDWPQSAIATRMGEVWARESGNLPLRIIAGDTWSAGM